MNTVTITNRISSDTALELKEFAGEVGLSVNALVNSIIVQTLKKRQVVLDPDLRPTQLLKDIMKQAEADHKAGKTTRTQSSDEALDHLKKMMKR